MFNNDFEKITYFVELMVSIFEVNKIEKYCIYCEKICLKNHDFTETKRYKININDLFEKKLILFVNVN